MPAPITLYFKADGSGPNFQLGSQLGGYELLSALPPPTIAYEQNNNWSAASVGYSLYPGQVNTPVAPGSTPLPNAAPNGSDSAISPRAYTGTIEAGTWSLGVGVEAQLVGGATISMCFRLYRCSNSAGTSPTQITSGTLESAAQVSSSSSEYFGVTVALPALQLNNEYLLLQIALHVQVAISGGDAILQQTSPAGGPVIQSPPFHEYVFPSVGVSADAVIIPATGAATGFTPADVAPLPLADKFSTAASPSAQPEDVAPLPLAQAAQTATGPWTTEVWEGFGALVFQVTSGVHATLNQTLGAATASATGAVQVDATAAVTLGAASTSATAAVAVDAQLAEALGALTSSATATAADEGQLAVTLGALTSSASAAVTVDASLGVTLDDVTISATGHVAGADVHGSLAVTLDDATPSATGAVQVDAQLAATLDAATITATAADLDGARLAVTLDDTQLGAAAQVVVDVAASPTLGALTSSASGAVADTAQLAAQLAAATLTASGANNIELEIDIEIARVFMAGVAISQVPPLLDVDVEIARFLAVAVGVTQP